MKCNLVRQLLPAYLDNEVADAEGTSIKAHIEECRQCREEADTLKLMQKQLYITLNTLADSPSQPEKTWTAIKKRIEAEQGVSLGVASAVMPERKSIISDYIRRVKMSLFGRSKWRLAAIGSALVTIVIALALILPAPGGTDKVLKVLAEEIARDSEAFKIVFEGEGEVQLEDVVPHGNSATVTFITTEGKRVTFEVDTKAEAVVETDKWIGFSSLDMPDDPEERARVEEAIRIAETDPTVQEFLAAGGLLQAAHAMPENGQTPGQETTHMVFYLPGDLKSQPVVNGHYMVEDIMAWVNIDTREVVRVDQGQEPISIVREEYALTEAEKQEATDIATASPDVQELLSQGCVIDDISRRSAESSEKTAQIMLIPKESQRSEPAKGYEVEVSLTKKEVSAIRPQWMLSAPVVVVQVSEWPTEEDFQKAVSIAEADPGFQELLAQGYSISDVSAMQGRPRMIEIWLNVPDGIHERIIDPEGRYTLFDFIMSVKVDLNKGEMWPIRKGMWGGRSEIEDPTQLSDAEVEQAKQIAAADPRVQELLALGCTVENVERIAYWGPGVGVVHLLVPESQWYHIRYDLNYRMHSSWDSYPDGNHIMRIVVVTDLEKNEVSQLAHDYPWDFGANGTYTWKASDGKTAIRVETPTITLTADNFYIEADGLKFLGQAEYVVVQGLIDPIEQHGRYGVLDWDWIEHGRKMRLELHLSYDGNYWWVDGLWTYDGQPHWEDDWIRYEGQFFKTEIGKAFTGDVDLASSDYEPDNDSLYPPNERQGRIHFENLRIEPILDE